MATEDRYRTLLAVSEAILSHRELPALLHALAGQLVQLVQSDALSVVLHDAATKMMRLHVLETGEPQASGLEIALRPEDDPAGLVWQTQEPLITSSVAELKRWPRFLERVQPFGVQSYCWLPLTTARRRLGALVFTSKQAGTYHESAVPFLQLVANQVAVAVENALAFQEIEALKDKLTKEKAYLEEEVRTQHHFGDIVGENVALRAVLKQVETVAPTESTVLIRGETGTGKELIAKAIHQLSPRAKQPFVTVHCAALAASLLESELFGHEKGAFTGAHERRIGRFEQAQGGTLFLDEIGEIDATIQIKLLRFLGERTFERVGSNKTLTADLRLLAATNKNLEEQVKAGKFREDLFFRLRVMEIQLPPLRERIGDIPLLAANFLREFAAENHKPVNDFTADAMELLINYSWPGNVRELRAAVEHAVVLCRGEKISARDLPPSVRAGGSTGATEPARLLARNDLTVKEAEKQLIVRALKETDGNRTRAAQRIGMSRRTFHRKLHTYHLEGF